MQINSIKELDTYSCSCFKKKALFDFLCEFLKEQTKKGDIYYSCQINSSQKKKPIFCNVCEHCKNLLKLGE